MLEQLWLFHCGYIRLPRSLVIADEPLGFPRMPMLCALAYHSERGPILIDAPFGHEGPSNAGDVLGAGLRLAGWRFEDAWSMVPRVEQLGFRTSEIHHILMTHLHWDHTGGMKELGHARFHVARSEWEFALDKPPMAALRAGYQVDDFRAMQNRVELFDDPLPVAEDADGVDLFGDGTICAVGLPGHSIGHVGYRLRLADGRRVFLVGDAAFCVDHVIERRSLGMLPRRAAFSLAQAEQTLRELRLYHDAHPDEVIIPSHDFEWGDRCMGGPTALHTSG
jgi:N-acyl homoserine lactone hydrolase